MRKILACCLGLSMLAACAVAPGDIEPAVSQYNGDSVSIQLDGTSMAFIAPDQKAVVLANADKRAVEICRRGHKKRAEYTSSRNIPTGQYSSVIERLYLCLN